MYKSYYSTRLESESDMPIIWYWIFSLRDSINSPITERDTYTRFSQLHVQFGQEECRAAHLDLLVGHEAVKLRLLMGHLHAQQLPQHTGRIPVQTVQQLAQAGSHVAEVLLFDWLLRNRRKGWVTVSTQNRKLLCSNLFKDQLHGVTQHKVIVPELGKGTLELSLNAIEHARIVVQLGNHLG